jgi:hypothetical protein
LVGVDLVEVAPSLDPPRIASTVASSSIVDLLTAIETERGFDRGHRRRRAAAVVRHHHRSQNGRSRCRPWPNSSRAAGIRMYERAGLEPVRWIHHMELPLARRSAGASPPLAGRGAPGQVRPRPSLRADLPGPQRRLPRPLGVRSVDAGILADVYDRLSELPARPFGRADRRLGEHHRRRGYLREAGIRHAYPHRPARPPPPRIDPSRSDPLRSAFIR